MSAYRESLKLVGNWRPALLVSRYAPFESHVVGHALSKVLAIPWVVFFSDPWPGFLHPVPYRREPRLGGRLLYKFWSHMIWSKASLIVFPSKRLLQLMLASHGTPRHGKAVVLPHISGTSPSTVGDRNEFRLVHCGAAGGARRLDLFLSGLQLFFQRNPPSRSRTRLVFIGKLDVSERENRLLKTINGNIEICGEVDYDESCQVIARATVLVLIEAPMANGVFLPGKFADYAGSGRPILAVSPAGGEVADLLRIAGQTVVSQKNPERVADRLQSMYTAWQGGSLEKVFSIEPIRSLFDARSVGTTFYTLCTNLAK